MQAKAARDLLGSATGSADGALVAASAWLQEGVLHRDLANMNDSCAALKAALGTALGQWVSHQLDLLDVWRRAGSIAVAMSCASSLAP